MSQHQTHHPPATSQIPNELLGDLLWLAVSSADDYVPSHFHIRYKTLSAIRRVCRHWNHIALSMTQLWRRVAVDVTTRTSRYPPPDVVNQWIQRTKGVQPIEILISMPSDQSPIRHSHAQAIFNVLSPYMIHWGELWFLSELGIEGFPRDLSRARHLTKLSIDAGILDEDAIEVVGPSFVTFPGIIRELHLEVATFDWITLWGRYYNMRLSGLETLGLQYEGWMEGVLNILSETRTSLTSANIHVDGQWSASPEYHTLSPDAQFTSFPMLRHLRLEIYDANLDLFKFLEMGGLKVLEVSITWSEVPRHARNIGPLLSFIEDRSPSLHTCAMWFDELRSNRSTQFFRSPTLSRLSTYKICNVKVESNTRQIIASSASHNIMNRISLIPEPSPGRFSVGWTGHS